jgi:polysaccharide deacetylase family protein (PEP-CTERM system associated)
MNILTFDIEDWFHILDNASTRDISDWTNYSSRCEPVVDRLLSILAERNLKATFFCLGWMAERHPQIIRRIHDLGHEIGTHSYAHQLAYEQTPDQFTQDFKRSLAALEDATGEKVRAYRAPGFSLTSANLWVFDELVMQGIEVDCSVFPAARAHGGFTGYDTDGPALIETRCGQLKEFPINVLEIFGLNLVFSGGGYFRLLPYSMIRVLARRSPYFMTYFHPRDFDADQPLVPGLNTIRRFKSYYGLSSAEGKLMRLLDDFEFIDLRTAVSRVDWDKAYRLVVS